jgi:hypothetical protein
MSDRSGADYYEFTIGSYIPPGGNATVAISKSTSSKALARTTIWAKSNGPNQLEAVCSKVSGKSTVNLKFWVNGKEVLHVTDGNNPFTSGTVGLEVQNSILPLSVSAKFDHFVVRKIGLGNTVTNLKQ